MHTPLHSTMKTPEPASGPLLPADTPPFLDAVAIAQLIGVAPATIRWHRHNGSGPRGFVTPGGRRVLYAKADVEAWLAAARDATLARDAARTERTA